MNWRLLRRSDGRVELVCAHGVGHVSERLTRHFSRKWERWMAVHGCDSCCSDPSFVEAEELAATAAATAREDSVK